MSNHKKISYSNIFWGLTLVAIGVLLALRNFDLLYFKWHSLLRLWPLLFIFWGISLIPVKQWVKLILTAVVIGAGIIIVIQNPHYHSDWGVIYFDDDEDAEVEVFSEDNSVYSYKDYQRKTDHVNVNIQAGAAEFSVKGKAEGLFEFQDYSDEKSFEILSESGENNETINVKQLKRTVKDEKFVRKAELVLNTKPSYSFDIDVGAAELVLDLKKLKVNDLLIDGGAADIRVYLGSRQVKSEVEINSGASHIEIHVPESVACEIHTDTFLASKDFNGFQKIGRGHYQTDNFSSSADQIIIDINAAISDLEVIRY